MNSPTPIDRFLQRSVLRLIPFSVTPNVITVFRMILTPFVVYMLIKANYAAGFVLFLITALTDAIDGAMARTRNQITDWGKTFDPFADKLLVLGVGIVILPQFLNPWLFGAIGVMELTLLINKFYLEYFRGSKVIQANIYGKIKMIMYCIGLGALMVYILWHSPFFFQTAQIFLYVALIPALISLIKYRSI